MTRTESGTNPAVQDRELVTSRILKATREAVFRAWTRPEHLARWWGPKGFTNTIYEFDPRPGGLWRFTMHGPDGMDYPNQSVFLEVAEPERIIIKHVSSPQFQLTAGFEEADGGTRLTWRMLFGTVEECERVRGLAVGANEENLDRLEAELERMGA